MLNTSSRKRHSSLRDFISQATQGLTRLQKRQRYPRSTSTEYHFDEARTRRKRPRYHTMADGEEDFSSLPLPDRFTHKVVSRAYWKTITDLYRSGKLEKPPTKMLPNSSQYRRTRTTLAFELLRATPVFGRALCSTPTLLHSQRVSQRYALS